MIPLISQLPEIGDIRTIFCSLFGGPAKLDLWLTGIADELADPQNPRVRPLPLANIPLFFQTWMHRPREVVDALLEQLHDLSVWAYTVTITGSGDCARALVIDQTSGHLLEEVGGRTERIIQVMTEKYRPNVKVIKE
jgi:hypothetical protein